MRIRLSRWWGGERVVEVRCGREVEVRWGW
jgi:hypothetical protein